MAKKHVEHTASGDGKTLFLSSVSWAGNNFSVMPGETIDWLPLEIAEARELAGLGTIIKG